MRRKLGWVMFLSAMVVVTSLYHVRTVHATPSSGFTSTTLSQGRFSAIGVSNFFVSDKGKVWLSEQRTHGQSDLYVQSNVWDPGGSTGWHSHPGHSLITVTAGTITAYEGNDQAARRTSIPLGWDLSITVAPTPTSSATKVRSQLKPSLSNSFRQASHVASTPLPPETAPSNHNRVIRSLCENSGRASPARPYFADLPCQVSNSVGRLAALRNLLFCTTKNRQDAAPDAPFHSFQRYNTRNDPFGRPTCVLDAFNPFPGFELRYSFS